MARPLDTPLQPAAAAQRHVQILSLHSSALLLLAPSTIAYPLAQPSTWLFELELQVRFAPSFAFLTAVQSLQAALVVTESLAHAVLV
jgi:hypothetical protein